jgi:hypothetical protein
MTYPASGLSNNNGPYFSSNPPVNTNPAQPPAAPPSVAQSPSGSVSNESATYNFTDTITSTENVLTNVLALESTQQGTAALTVPVVINGCTSTAQNAWQSSCEEKSRS